MQKKERKLWEQIEKVTSNSTKKQNEPAYILKGQRKNTIEGESMHSLCTYLNCFFHVGGERKEA